MMDSNINWQEIYTFGSPLPEIILRGTPVYLALLLILRFGGKRTTGGIGITALIERSSPRYRPKPAPLLALTMTNAMSLVVTARKRSSAACRAKFLISIEAAPACKYLQGGRSFEI